MADPYFNENNFGFRDNQNISQPFPINFNNITDIFNLSIPEELPNVTKEDVNKNANDNTIDANYINILFMTLRNLLQEVPQFQIPPLFNVANLQFKNKFQNAYTDYIIKSSPYNYQQQQCPPFNYQQQQLPPFNYQQQQQQLPLHHQVSLQQQQQKTMPSQQQSPIQQ